MPIPCCRIRLGGAAPHLSQIAAGFSLLEQQGLLRIHCEGIAPFRGKGIFEHCIILEATFEDGSVLVYDTADGYEDILRPDVFDEQLDRVTIYYKRSFDPAFLNGKRNNRKMRPLGLNYAVTCRGNFMERFEPRLGNLPRSGLTAEEFISHNSYPEYKGLFLARLWSPENIKGRFIRTMHPYLSEEEAEEIAARNIEAVERMNQLRIEVIRACREAFGDQFYGGLEDTFFAQRCAPDLVLPVAETRRNVFLQRLKENYVCLANEGLHGSIGWKLAEYTAAGRAILTNKLQYDLPGAFRFGNNYALYESAEDCVLRLGELLNNPPRIHRMEAANFAYHNMYVRPDAMILYSLQNALPELFPFGEQNAE